MKIVPEMIPYAQSLLAYCEDDIMRQVLIESYRELKEDYAEAESIETTTPNHREERGIMEQPCIELVNGFEEVYNTEYQENLKALTDEQTVIEAMLLADKAVQLWWGTGTGK